MSEQRIQRRLAAVLAADVAGYSRLMGRDEVGTLAMLTAHLTEFLEPCLIEHNGRLVKTTGDGLLAEFASVVDAVRCAIAMQKGLSRRNSSIPSNRRLDFRIGVNLGDIIVQQGDIYGDGVNVAARLQEIAEPGGICISGDSFRQIRGKLTVAATDAGEVKLKNISDPVRIYRIPINYTTGSTPKPIYKKISNAPAYVVIAFLTASLFSGLTLYFLDMASILAPSETANRPSIPEDAGYDFPVVAVLPFANQTGDEEQSYLADGITEEIIGALGRFSSLRVISYNTVIAFRSRAFSRDIVARDLAVSYLVEGSVKRSGDQLRIAARLIDPMESTVLWADRYDGRQSEIFDFQDAITREIAGRLAVKIAHIKSQEALRRSRPDQGAYELFLRARAIGIRAGRKENRLSRELASQAIEVDPNFAAGYALLAEASYMRVILGWSVSPDRELSDAESLARKAIMLAPNEAEGHRALGRILVTRTEYEEALDHLRRAVEINPSDASALATQGIAFVYEGELPKGIDALERALKYDPALESSDSFHLALAYYLSGQDDQALRTVRRGIETYPEFPMSYVLGAIAATRLGQKEQAQRFVEEARRRLPFLDRDSLGSRFRRPEHRAYLSQGLAATGF